MTRSILILGAGGFIGRHVTRALAGLDGVSPIAAGRHVRDGAFGPTPVRRVDGADPVALRAALAGVDAVVNCVAAAPAAMAQADATLFQVAREAGRPLIVHLSSMAVYGDATGTVGEGAPLSDAQGAYAAAKIASERLAADYGRAVVLRPGCVYGTGGEQWTLRVARLLRARRLGDLGAAGDGISNLVHANDVAQAVAAALSLPTATGRAFNLAMADSPTWNDYFIAFAKALGAVPVRRLTDRRIKLETKLIAPPLKVLEILAHKAGGRAALVPPYIPPSSARLWRQEIRLDPGAAESVLGLRWTPLADGLAESAAWCAAVQGWRA